MAKGLTNGTAPIKAYKQGNYFSKELHSLKDIENIIDIRNIGLMGAIQLQSNGTAGARGNAIFLECYKNNLLVRATGDTIVLSPAYIVSEQEIKNIVRIISDAIKVVG